MTKFDRACQMYSAPETLESELTVLAPWLSFNFSLVQLFCDRAIELGIDESTCCFLDPSLPPSITETSPGGFKVSAEELLASIDPFPYARECFRTSMHLMFSVYEHYRSGVFGRDEYVKQIVALLVAQVDRLMQLELIAKWANQPESTASGSEADDTAGALS
jgi:hypothetical protein